MEEEIKENENQVEQPEEYGIIANDGYKLLKGFIKKRLNSDSDLAIAVTSEV